MINTEKIERFNGPDGERFTNDEMVNLIITKTGVTKEQAQEALDKSSHDLIDAMIYVERTYGQASAQQTAAQQPAQNAQAAQPAQNAQATQNAQSAQNAQYAQNPQYTQQPHVNFDYKKAAVNAEDKVTKAVKYLLSNYITVCKDGKEVTSIPLLICIAAVLVSCSTVLLVALVAMFFGINYRLTGPNVAGSPVNILFDSIYGVVNSLKKSFSGTKY